MPMNPQQLARLRAMWMNMKGNQKAQQWKRASSFIKRDLSPVIFPKTGEYRGIAARYKRQGFISGFGKRRFQKTIEHREAEANLMREARRRGKIPDYPMPSQQDTLTTYTTEQIKNITRRLGNTKSSKRRAMLGRETESLASLKSHHVKAMHTRAIEMQNRAAKVAHRIRKKKRGT